MNITVSSPIAKLLKEKDEVFDVTSTLDYPTIAEVVMWLYEKHGIWIGVELTDNTTDFYFQQTIWTSKDRDWNDTDMVDQAKSICKWKEWKYNSPAEAYEAAILYTLNNLI